MTQMLVEWICKGCGHNWLGRPATRRIRSCSRCGSGMTQEACEPEYSYEKVDIASDIVDLMEQLQLLAIQDDSPYRLVRKTRGALQRLVTEFKEETP